jgi:hypothetical protein
MKRRSHVIAILAVIWCALCTLNLADEPSDEDSESDVAEVAEVAEVAKAFVEKCRLTAGVKKGSELTLHPKPLLRWSNPTAGRVYGDVYLWTANGRPCAVASYYRWFTPNWGDTFEITSLTDGPITAQSEGVQFWNTSTAGLTMQSLQNADLPASTAAARLTQMRRLASGFVVELLDTRNNDSGVDRDLRLLNQPVFRYPTPGGKSQYVDGAMFAFVEGTDPEVLLLLEANGDASNPSWSFGFSRMNRDSLRITYRDLEVWTAPFVEQWDGRFREPYAIYAMRKPLPSVP